MLATRQIIEDPQDVIPIPPEFRHRRTEVIFMALEPESIKPPQQNLATETVKVPRTDWFVTIQTSTVFRPSRFLKPGRSWRNNIFFNRMI
ncbi:MAG: hypothetical protein EPN17_05815 [Methylobacter sp.]|nr:MAG: hypothetical protein EPN17_05815 [Methylobacter sp.]